MKFVSQGYQLLQVLGMHVSWSQSLKTVTLGKIFLLFVDIADVIVVIGHWSLKLYWSFVVYFISLFGYVVIMLLFQKYDESVVISELGVTETSYNPTTTPFLG